MSIEEFFARIDASEKAYQEGNVISSEQLRKEMKTINTLDNNQ